MYSIVAHSSFKPSWQHIYYLLLWQIVTASKLLQELQHFWPALIGKFMSYYSSNKLSDGILHKFLWFINQSLQDSLFYPVKQVL